MARFKKGDTVLVIRRHGEIYTLDEGTVEQVRQGGMAYYVRAPIGDEYDTGRVFEATEAGYREAAASLRIILAELRTAQLRTIQQIDEFVAKHLDN